MIRVTVEMVPFGVEELATKLAILFIANDGSGSRTRGNYNYSISTGKKTWRKGRIENFPRRSCSVWNLIYRVLRGVFENGKE